jgi:hypothetical protein
MKSITAQRIKSVSQVGFILSLSSLEQPIRTIVTKDHIKRAEEKKEEVLEQKTIPEKDDRIRDNEKENTDS